MNGNGPAPYTCNDRIMETLGSIDNPWPLVPTDSAINGAKGLIMDLRAPISINSILDAARDAVRSDTRTDADALLSQVRIVCVIQLIEPARYEPPIS